VGRDFDDHPTHKTVHVSIHAPAWGATGTVIANSRIGACFNPRARVGRDRVLEEATMSSKRFNPRARVGRDSKTLKAKAVKGCFNPRARVGRDGLDLPLCGMLSSFNPRARVGRDFLRYVR